jgi:hypothetical protein
MGEGLSVAAEQDLPNFGPQLLWMDVAENMGGTNIMTDKMQAEETSC